MGFLGYDVVREVERLPDVPPDDRRPARRGDERHRLARRVRPLAPAGLPDRERARARPRRRRARRAPTTRRCARVERAVADLARPLPYVPVAPPDADDELPEVRSSMGSGMYQQAVEVAKEHILAGDIFQVVLAQRYDIELDADPFDVYRVLRQVNPSPYMYFLRHPEITIVGSSPEPMVQVLGRKVISPADRRHPPPRPRRRARPAHGRRAEGEPEGGRRAHHARRPRPQRRRPRRPVRHGARRRADDARALQPRDAPHVAGDAANSSTARTPIDVLRATLPAGTVSGAPKVRAMEIIDELEPVKRGPYAGVVGYVDFTGNLDTAIAIRTMFVGPNGASLQAGAGIVADSVPDDEDLECRNKAAALLAAVPARPPMTAQRNAAETPA